MSTRLFWVAIMGTLALGGQVETARIVGSVRDASGGMIIRATVVFTNVDTNIGSRTETNDTGRYESFPLHIGKYRVTAEQAGFKRTVREGITLQIQETAVVDFMLEVGATSMEVSVVAAAPLLTVNEATQSQVIDNQKMVDLPLNGRTYSQLALLSGGTGDPAANSRTRGFSGSGMRVSLNNYLLDGIDNNNRQLAAAGRQAETMSPSVDALQEFKVMTNSFSAEYGRAAGAVVNAGIKSGTNALHGTAFEFLRNEALDAKNFFDLPTQPKPPLRRNQFGGSVGGPVRKDKTFFFGDYEWNRIRDSRTANSNVPVPRMLGGDFSDILPVRIYDPDTYNAATDTRQPFTGNVIPKSRFDPVAVKVLAWYPTPNKPGLANNYLYNPPYPQDWHKWDAKTDHTFGPRDNLFARFSFQRAILPMSPAMPVPAIGGGQGGLGVSFRHDGRNLGVGYNHVFTPTLILSMKAGWNRIFTNRFTPVTENLNQVIGLKGVDTTLPGSANFNPNGYAQLGAGGFNPNYSDSQTRQLITDATWIHGRHTLKFGANLGWMQMYEYNAGYSVGLFSFAKTFTSNKKKEGDGIADMLLGAATTAQVSNIGYMNQRAPWYDLYVQEEWKATRHLTLNLGLRYELRLPFVETRNGWANFDVDSLPGQARLVDAKNGSRDDRATIRTDWNNFGPRFGFAWQPTKNTVVRGGYGIYYAGFQPFGDSKYLHSNPPYQLNAQLSTDPVRPTILLRDGLPGSALDLRNAQNVTVSSYDRGGVLPYTHQWTFSVQRQLPGELLLEAGYYANTAHKLLQQIEGNWALPGPGDVNGRRRFRSVAVPSTNTAVTLSNCWRYQWSANANFHSLQIRAEKRLTHGLSLLASYAWSKSISDARGSTPDGGASSAETPQNPRNLRAERSLADEHLPHRFVISEIYELPFGQGKRFMTNPHALLQGVLGHWTLAGITTLESGMRVNLLVGSKPSNTGDPNRPNVVHDWHLGSPDQSLQRWFDATAFEAAAQYTFGNAGRNLIGGPPLYNFDLAAYKSFRIAEGRRLQFRVEVFNSFNTPPFQAPQGGWDVGTSTFGVIGSAGRGRNLQFGLKYIF